MIPLNSPRGRQVPTSVIGLPSMSATIAAITGLLIPALTRSHPATGESLELVWSRTDASAGTSSQRRAPRPVESIENERSACSRSSAALIDTAPVAHGFAEMAEQHGRIEGCRQSRQLIIRCTVALALHPRRDQNCLLPHRTSFYNGTRIAASAEREGEPGNENPDHLLLALPNSIWGPRIVTSARELPFGGPLGALLDRAADHIAHRHGHEPDVADADPRHRVALRSRPSLSAPKWRGRMATSPATKLPPLTRCFGYLRMKKTMSGWYSTSPAGARTVLKVARARLGECS